jgi:hypothetical protein
MITVRLLNGEEITIDALSRVEDAISEGILDAICKQCGEDVRTEPDAENNFCSSCNKVQPIINPFFLVGF